MDEQKIINVSDNTANELLKNVTASCYNNGYINGCVDGIKAGKKVGENQGWIKGFFFAVITGLFAYFSCKLIKGMVKEAVDICSDDSSDNCSFREVKEEQNGSESV